MQNSTSGEVTIADAISELRSAQISLGYLCTLGFIEKEDMDKVTQLLQDMKTPLFARLSQEGKSS